MRSALLRRRFPITASALMAALLLPSAQAGATGPPTRFPVPPSTALRARITGAVIPGTSTAAAAAPAAASGLSPELEHIKWLTEALATMKHNIAEFAESK